MNDTEEIGCCGAYCKTCREYQKSCKGCKQGYLDGSRDLSRAKCRFEPGQMQDEEMLPD